MNLMPLILVPLQMILPSCYVNAHIAGVGDTINGLLMSKEMFFKSFLFYCLKTALITH